jgi:flavin-binding protein dodecin
MMRRQRRPTDRAAKEEGRRRHVSDHVYKRVEITGTSSKGTDDAIRNAIAKAGQTVHNLRWFEVVEVRGGIDGNSVASWQVTIKIGFTLDE